MRKAFIVAVALIFAGAASAHAGHFTGEEVDYENSTVAELVEDPDPVVSGYNSRAGDLPLLVKSLVSGERINVHIETPEDEVVVGAVMDGARVDAVERGGVENATVEFHTDVAALETIVTAENPRQEAVAAFNGPQITYETRGFGSAIKFAVISAVSKVFGFLL